jgi:hypothetical protein
MDEPFRDLVSSGVGFPQPPQSAIRKHHPPAEGAPAPVALHDLELRGRVTEGELYRDIEARRASANDCHTHRHGSGILSNPGRFLNRENILSRRHLLVVKRSWKLVHSWEYRCWKACRSNRRTDAPQADAPL